MCHARTTRMQRASTRVQKTACRQTIGASLACAFTCACAQFAAYGRLLLDGCAQRSKLVHSYISSMLYLTTVRPLQGPNLPLDDLEALMTGIYASPVGCLCTCAIARHAASHIARRNTTCNMYASHRRENATRHPRGHSRMRMHKIAPSHTHAQSRTHALARRILPQRRIRALHLRGAVLLRDCWRGRFDNEVVPGQHVAQIATTVARPDRGYGGTYGHAMPTLPVGCWAVRARRMRGLPVAWRMPSAMATLISHVV
jgi:hypothetical protein